MEGKKQTGSSSSSFTSDLFGSNEYSPSSTGIFGSIFAPASPKVLGRESLRFEVAEKKQDSADDAWNTKSGTPASGMINMHHGYAGRYDVFRMNWKVSLITSRFARYFKKDGPEDDTGSASRGNWWQGMNC
ncbi:hypothetical protein POTOM_025172 [Populus tomentosa]|uniref:Uncharacterized protein n=1 Tax=Populus tomentosa TaxID=118781 RepID=A0A8X7ZHL0_POPTO|nr:hypothetical protein POTOM_025172 [Populus tomentosa]